MGAILTLQTNVPETIALQYGEGLQVEGQYGPRVMFTLLDGRKMYAPPIVQDLIVKAKIGRGDEFQICKREVKEGGKGKINWEVKPVPPAGQPGIAPPAGPQADTHNNTKDPITGKSKTELMNDLGQLLVGGAARVGNNGNGSNGRSGPDVASPALMSGLGQFYLGRATLLIDVIAAAHQHSAESHSGKFTLEDVRSIVATVYIQKEGGR